MSKAAKNDKQAEKDPTEFKKSAVFAPALIRNYASFDYYYERIEKLYQDAEEKFFRSDLTDPELPKLASAWEENSRTLIMAAAALFGHHSGKFEYKEKALATLERCKQDSGVRAENMMMHYEMISRNAEAEDGDKVLNLLKKTDASWRFFVRAYSTQTHYLNLFVNDPNYMTPELRLEKKYSKDAAYLMSKVPRGHIFLPARPFPPFRVPEGEPVPWIPEPYEAWKNVPVEDLIYDIDHDEFVLPEGYVSEDGRIDDKSVVWDWENNTVTMKFVGEEPITWPFWKPKDTSDVLKKGDWAAEYFIRLYRQILEAAEPPGASGD